MKKLLLVALLMLALVITAVACNNEPADTTGETTATQTPATAEPDDSTAAPETPTEAPETPTEAPEVPTEAPDTQAPEVPTDAPVTQAPVVTTEPETEAPVDPMAPINVFEAADIQTITGGDPNNLTQDCVSLEGDYLHVVPIGADPYWYPFSNVNGGRYVSIRYRTADATNASMQIYIASTGAGPSDDTTMLQQPVIVDGEWHLAIFDTQSLIDAGKYDGSTVSYFRFDALEAGYILDENGQPYKPDGQNYARYTLPEGCSIDVEYIAFFHSAEAAEKYDADTHFVVPPHDDLTLVLGTGHGAPFSGVPAKKFGQRGQIGENFLKNVTIVDLATYADNNTNTWSFKVWQWDTDYATTVAGEPLFVKEGENHPDNTTFSMDIPAELGIRGDIYYEIEYLSGTGTFTGWTADSVVEGLETYVAGELKAGGYAASITVGVAKTPAEPSWIIDPAGMANASPVNAATVTVNEDGYASFTATGGDPWALLTGNIGEMPEYLAFSYRTNTTQGGEIFLSDGAGPEGGKSFLFNYTADGEWHLMVFHLPTVAPYMTSNTVGFIRFDFYTGGAEDGAFMDVEYFAFFETEELANEYFAFEHGTTEPDEPTPITVDGDFADWADKVVTDIPVSDFIAWTGTAPESFNLKTSFTSDGEYLYVYLNPGENSGVTMYQICLITDNTVASDAAQAWYNVTFADGAAAIAGATGACKGEAKVFMTGTEVEAAIPIAAIYGEGFALPAETRILLVAQINGGTHMGTFHDGKNPNDDSWADRTGDGCPLTLNADGSYTIDLPKAEEPEEPVENYNVPQDQWTVSGHCPQIVGKEGHGNSAMVAAGGVESGALLHQGSIALGEIDLSKYSKVIIHYGVDGSDVTWNHYNASANNRIMLVSADTNMTNSPADGTVIAGATYEPCGWAVQAFEIDLTGVDYNGPVFVTYDTLPGTFMLFSSVEFIA